MTLPRGLFVVGTDTGVGKTRLSSAIVRALRGEGYRVGAIKPVATGTQASEHGPRSEDVESLAAALEEGAPRERICPLLFARPMAPPIAARLEGRPLLRDELEGAVSGALEWWSSRADVVVVEGVGGWLCPIAEETTVADLAEALDYPILIVGRRALGTLNHTLLTVESARRRSVRIAGVVLNGAEPTEDAEVEAWNADELARHLRGIPILPDSPHGADPLAWAVAPGVSPWYVRCSVPRFCSLATRSSGANSHVDVE